jgi:Poly(ADP-ribose) polymerase catalytic domain
MRHNQSTNWHRQVEATAATHGALNTDQLYGHSSPLIQLKGHTDLYLKKKGNLTSSERDARLIALIRAQSLKDVAVVACAHALSPQALRDLLLGELQLDPRIQVDSLLYLHAIVASHHANPGAVSLFEAQFAQAMITLSSHNALAIGHDLQIFAMRMTTLITAGIPTDLFMSPVVNEIPRRACANFATQLEHMELERLWVRAHSATSWLSTLPGTSPITEQLLSGSFPTWRIWAAWRPDIDCLQLIEERLAAEKRRELGDIIALEGPDFTNSGKETLREGLLAQVMNSSASSISYGRVLIKLENSTECEVRTMLARFMDAFCTAVSASPNALALFIHICLRNPVDTTMLQIVERVNTIGDSSVSKAVLDMLTSQANAVRVAAIMTLLPTMNGVHGESLREVLSPYIINPLDQMISELQDKFCEHIQNGRTLAGVGTKLQEFGEALRSASWLQPVLNDRLQPLLDHWPTAEDLHALIDLRKDARGTTQNSSSSLSTMIDTYCMARLAGRVTTNEATRNTVEGLTHLWQQPPDPERRAAALAIAERSAIPYQLRLQCLNRLSEMTSRFVLAVSSIVSKETEMACVNFAQLLVSQKSLNTDNIRCWRDLLLYMIEQKSRTLLDYTLAHLQVESWLRWLNNLRVIFRNVLGHLSAPFTILEKSLHDWSQHLAEKYLPTLISIETTHGSKSMMHWILKGWNDSESVIPLLEVLQNPGKERVQGVTKALMVFLTPNGSNARQIYDTLSQLNQTTPPGMHACQRVLELHQKPPKGVAEIMMAAWLQGSELNAIDKRALKAMATVLRIQVYDRGNPPAASMQAVKDYLDDEYKAVLAEAIHVESMRITLKTHSPKKTAELLANLSVEDPLAFENDISNIPNSLIDVVERIGEGEFELSFPLTHLKPFQRTALGIGSARMLLVRLLVGNGRKPPEFCIHLHPEPGGNVPNETTNNGHSYWRASPRSSAPDMHFCKRGRANRFTYQLNRNLWGHLVGGFQSLEATHKRLTLAIDNLPQNCMTCGSPVGVRVWRSTCCTKTCSIQLRRSNLEVRLADLRHDPAVVDLLLSMAYSSAIVGDPELLPGSPITDKTNLLNALNALPALTSLQTATDLPTTIQSLGAPTEALLSWLCTSHRSFFASATGALKIPSMPGVHQFVLANAAPEREIAFSAHTNAGNPQPGHVVFHGTTLARLYLILREGLRICSGTKWQINGASSGRGIYCADEPGTAFGYGYNYFNNNTGSGSGWRASSPFLNVRVVLGCELMGAVSGRGVHVVSDASRLMVRYIFLFTGNATAPTANLVQPALASAFASLRKGTL